jgi:predicted DNA-binding transcriptional regulator YafY
MSESRGELAGQVVTIRYTNWRGETADRRIIPHAGTLRFAATDYHPDAQWVFDAWDVDRAAVRTFALASVRAWTPE